MVRVVSFCLTAIAFGTGNASKASKVVLPRRRPPVPEKLELGAVVGIPRGGSELVAKIASFILVRQGTRRVFAPEKTISDVYGFDRLPVRNLIMRHIGANMLAPGVILGSMLVNEEFLGVLCLSCLLTVLLVDQCYRAVNANKFLLYVSMTLYNGELCSSCPR